MNIPVVPIFWIAGEDHDFQEVNHIYLEKKGKIQKVTYPEKVLEKRMVSDIELRSGTLLKWVEEIIRDLGETDHTNEFASLYARGSSKIGNICRFFRSNHNGII